MQYAIEIINLEYKGIVISLYLCKERQETSMRCGLGVSNAQAVEHYE
jgi:hypothetical protein